MSRPSGTQVPPTVDAHDLTRWTGSVLASLGYDPADAAYLAGTLVDANLRGLDSHGVIRLPIYARRIQSRLVDPVAKPVVHRGRGIVRIDANGAPGQLAARLAVEELTDAARQNGVATAVVRGSSHFGTAGFYARALAERGFVAIVASNSEPIVVPFGGRKPLMGTNPIAFAAPGPDSVLSLDMATSTTAMGKVLVAQSAGRTVPDTWGVDADGAPSTDPSRIVALLPFAGPKGYGLAFMIEILAGALSGSAMTSGLGNQYSDFDRPQNIGHWMLAVDIASLMPLDDFRARVAELCDQAHSAPTAPGFERVLVPGEPEELTRAERLAHGIPVDTEVVAELTALGRSTGVSFPDPMDGDRP